MVSHPLLNDSFILLAVIDFRGFLSLQKSTLWILVRSYQTIIGRRTISSFAKNIFPRFDFVRPSKLKSGPLHLKLHLIKPLQSSGAAWKTISWSLPVHPKKTMSAQKTNLQVSWRLVNTSHMARKNWKLRKRDFWPKKWKYQWLWIVRVQLKLRVGLLKEAVFLVLWRMQRRNKVILRNNPYL